MNICIVGMGYVGASLAALLGEKHTVYALDTDAEKLAALARGEAPVSEEGIARRMQSSRLDIRPEEDSAQAVRASSLVIVAVPTDYDPETSRFDTSIVEEVVEAAFVAHPEATIVIRSTVPVGFTSALAARLPGVHLLVSPEFLREDHAWEDSVHPSRIVVGVPVPMGKDGEWSEGQGEGEARGFARLVLDCCADVDVPVFVMGAAEAEAVKLFSNTYLALRVAYFNELDTYAFMKGLDTSEIIDAVSADPRIGAGYNNPSFGFGGYCLPKDTKQLLANYEDVPQRLIAAVIEANQTRKDAMVEAIVARAGQCAADEGDMLVGVYRLGMKAASDKMRASSVLDVVGGIAARGIPLLVYEPALPECKEPAYEVTHDLAAFLDRSHMIVANRFHKDLAPAASKVFTRDLFPTV